MFSQQILYLVITVLIHFMIENIYSFNDEKHKMKTGASKKEFQCN